jgi:translation initiation factor IF-3
MSQKSAKKKSKKGAKSDAAPSVLGNLPATRPTRLGGSRDGAAKSRAKTATGSTKTTAAPAKTTKPRRTKATAARPKPAAAPKTTAARPEPAAPAEPKPVPQADRDGRRSGPPTGVELVTTAARAAGELTQIGFTIGRQMLKRATDRLPRR